LRFEAETKKRKKKRAGKHHQRRNPKTSQQTWADSPPASTESSPGSTPEKKQPDRVRPAYASTTLAVESVTNSGNNAKRQRDSSPARVPAVIGGLTINDFGDLASDYNAVLERESVIYNSVKDAGKSLVERKHDGIPTSSGNVSNFSIRNRQNHLKKERQGYQNRCVSQHCENGGPLINNPFTKPCRCNQPSAGDLPG
jgi:hypothetical protein